MFCESVFACAHKQDISCNNFPHLSHSISAVTIYRVRKMSKMSKTRTVWQCCCADIVAAFCRRCGSIVPPLCHSSGSVITALCPCCGAVVLLLCCGNANLVPPLLPLWRCCYCSLVVPFSGIVVT